MGPAAEIKNLVQTKYKGDVRSQVWGRTCPQIREQVMNQVWLQIYEKVSINVGHQIWDEVWEDFFR